MKKLLIIVLLAGLIMLTGCSGEIKIPVRLEVRFEPVREP